MRIVTIEGFVARCEAKGIERSVNLILMQHEALAPGDVVMVHVGYAIQMMTEEEARASWDLIDEMLAEEEKLQTQAPIPDDAYATPRTRAGAGDA